jgi:hypothetical protein
VGAVKSACPKHGRNEYTCGLCCDEERGHRQHLEAEVASLRAQLDQSVPHVAAEVFNAAVNKATALAKDRDNWKRLHDESETECHRLRERVALLETALKTIAESREWSTGHVRCIDVAAAALSEKPEGT